MVNKEIIYGRNSVIEALKSPRITAEKLYIPQTEVDPALAKIRRNSMTWQEMATIKGLF